MRSRPQTTVAVASLVVLLPLLAAADGEEPAAQSTVEATSFLGHELRRPDLPPAFREQQSKLLEEAREAFVAQPDDPDALIWVGRRTAYLGRYREAVEIYSTGIAQHPDYAPLYRHRGHRHISLRQLDAAVADLSRAAELIDGTPDEVEQDGLPNARGIPTSTLHSNIWYHLGLAHYLRGDFESALTAYRADLGVASNPDMLAATSHWLYMTLRRLGRDAEAAEVLEAIDAGMDIIENHEYHRLLLMYKGEIGADELLAEIAGDGDSLSSATTGYGVGNWFLYNGDAARAKEIFTRIVDGNQWASFGSIAAEAELARWN